MPDSKCLKVKPDLFTHIPGAFPSTEHTKVFNKPRTRLNWAKVIGLGVERTKNSMEQPKRSDLEWQAFCRGDTAAGPGWMTQKGTY